MSALKNLGNKKNVIAITAACLFTAVLVFSYLFLKFDFSDQFVEPDFGDETLLFVGSSRVEDGSDDTYPIVGFINPRNWSIKTLNLNAFPGLPAEGMVKAEPFSLGGIKQPDPNTVPGLKTTGALGAVEAASFLLNGEERWAVSTRHPGAVLILKKTDLLRNNLEVEFADVIDRIVRALFVGDITGDGREEIVVGTRPKGILKYYTFADGQWSGTTIDTLGGTIHDLLIADLNEDGINEILLTTHIPLHEMGLETEIPTYTPKILKYEFDREQNTWIRSVIAEYTALRLFSESQELLFGHLNFNAYYPHPRYLFLEDFYGDGSKEIVTNQRGGDNRYLLSLKRQETGYVELVVEDELLINRQVVAVGDITNNGRAEIIATTQSDDALLLYEYAQGKWKKTIIAKDLTGESLPAGEARDEQGEIVQFAYVLKSSKGGYKNIFYMVSGLKADAARFYLLSYNQKKDIWEKELVAELAMGIQSWYITTAFPESEPREFPLQGNVFLPCETIPQTTSKYGCYKDAAVFAMQNGISVQELYTFVEKYRKMWHFKEHAIGRAALITSDYSLQSAGEKCVDAKCTTGYGHGLALAWGEYTKKISISDSDIEKNADSLMYFIANFCNSCYHHLGHYYGSISDTPEKNLENMDLCDKIKNNNDYSACVMGITHQHFQDRVPGIEDFFAKCQNHAITRKQEACYGYGSYFFARWSAWDTGIQGALNTCRELNKKVPLEWNRCYEGVREQLHRWEKTPDISWCGNLPAAFKELCVEHLSSPPRIVDLDGELECGSTTFACQAPPDI